MSPSPTSIFTPSRALLIAASLIAVALALRWLAPEYIGTDFAQRALGVMLGMLVILYANAVPKMLEPLLRAGGDPASAQGLRRFTGIALVLGGLAYSLAWMLAPLDRAALVAGGLLAVAVALVIARWAWSMASASRTERK